MKRFLLVAALLLSFALGGATAAGNEVALLDGSYQQFKLSREYLKWKTGNPTEAAALNTYWANGGTAPTVSSNFGKALSLEAQARWSLAAPPPPPPSGGPELLGWGPAEQDAARAGWVPSRTFTVTTHADWWAKWNDLQSGDRIIYAAPPLMGYQTLHDKRPTGRAEVIGLKLGGTTTNVQAADIWNLTNVHFYDMDVTNPNGTGFVVWTSIDSSFWGTVHDTCNGGVAHYNDVSESSGLDFRGLIRNAARPECDIGHPEEPGTGNHGFYLGGNNYTTRNSVFSYRMEGIHAGAGMQIGGDVADVRIYLEIDLNDAPKPSFYVAGNGLQFWGDNYQNVTVPYVYCEDMNGRCVETDGVYDSVAPGEVVVEYGRGLRCLLDLRDGLPSSDRYFAPDDDAVVYQDISPL